MAKANHAHTTSRTSKTTTAKDRGKRTPIRSIITQFKKAAQAHQDAKDRTATIAGTIAGTSVMVPELGASHYFSPVEIDRGAANYIQQSGLKRGTKAFAAFQERIKSYKDALNQLVLLRQDWDDTRGLTAAQHTQNDAFLLMQTAWEWIVARLAYREDQPAIYEFLGSGYFLLEPWRLRQALTAASKHRGR